MKPRLIFLILGLLIFSTQQIISMGSWEKTPRITNTTKLVNQNSVKIPFSSSQENHTLTPPTITYPTGNPDEILRGLVRITWTKAVDSHNLPVLYTVSYCKDGNKIWVTLKSEITETYYIWDTRNTDWPKYCIQVEATCSTGLTSNDSVCGIQVQSDLTREVRLLLSIILFMLILIILIGAFLYRKRADFTIGGFPSPNDLKSARLGLCIGSFSDKGLIIKGINDGCPFSLSQIQSMLEFSAAIHQHGKTETIYGPIPLTSLQDTQQHKESLQREWSLISYWMKVKDSTVQDSRVIKIGGLVQAFLLIFYPKQIDHAITVNKNNIVGIFKSKIDREFDISNFSDDLLNQLEKQLLELLLVKLRVLQKVFG